jgi:hypothetical protein
MVGSGHGPWHLARAKPSPWDSRWSSKRLSGDLDNTDIPLYGMQAALLARTFGRGLKPRPNELCSATHKNPDEYSGYNGAGQGAERIAFSHRFEFRRKRGDLLGGGLGHVAGRRSGLVSCSLASVDRISDGVLHGIKGFMRGVSYRVA